MSNLLEKLVEVVGDEEVAKKVQSAVGEFMLPKPEYAKIKEALSLKEKELEEIRLASMDNEQKLQHELAKASALQKEYAVKTNRLEAERVFVEAGLSSSDYGDILDKSVSDDKERTLSLVNGFVGILSKEKEAVASRTKEELINSTKKPETGDALDETKPIKIKTTF